MTKCISSVSAVLKHLYNGDHSNFPIESLKDLLFGVSKESVLEQLKNDDWDTPENINTINNWYKAVNKFDQLPESEEDGEREMEIDYKNISSPFTFVSPTEATRKLFNGKQHIYNKYENSIRAFFIKNLYWNRKLEFQISNDEQLRNNLYQIINFFAKKVGFISQDGKPLIDLTNPNNIVVNVLDFHKLNNIVEKTIREGNIDDLMELDNSKSPKFTSARKLAYAITFANFNSVLKLYLRDVIHVESKSPSFTPYNVNRNDQYQIAETTLTQGFIDEDRVLNQTSATAKLLINSFDRYNVFIKNKQLVVPKDQKPPNIHLPNYYYVVFQLSKFLYRKGDNSLISINPENFEQELEQFMRAILASKILTGESNVLKSWEKNPESKSLYGKFDSEVINQFLAENPFILDSVHLSTLLTFYHNQFALEKDPLYEYAPFKMNENNTVVSKMQDKFSLKQYYATYHKNSNFFKNNIFNLIFDTFKGITPRQYHDFAYVHDLKTVSAIPLTQKFLLQEIYEFSKIHKNANISSEMLSLFVPNSDFVGKDHISILDGNKVLRIEKRNGKWPDIEGSSEQRVLELFRVLTDIDLLTNPVILNHSAFSQEKILHVIHAILNIHNSGKRDQVLSSKKALGDTWNKYAAEGVNVNSILIGMGEQYAQTVGSYTKLTILDRSKKQLPLYSNPQLIYQFEEHLSHIQGSRPFNIFVRNVGLFKGTSIRNDIVMDGQSTKFQKASDKDKFIINFFYEWLQRRRNIHKGQTDNRSINPDNTIHMQPTVYADKPLQIALKMSGLQNILFDGFDENGRRIVKTIKAHELNAFNVNVLNQLLEATYESTREEHRLYFNYVSEAYRGFANYLSQKYNVPVDLNQDFTKLFEFAKAAIGTNDFAVEFNLFAETQSYPLIRRLLFEKGRGQYKLNNTLVGTFIKYNFIGPKNDRFTMDHKLGIIDFLSDIVKYEINHKDSNLKLFNDSTDSLSAELGKLDKAQLKILQSEIQDRVLKNDRTIYDDQTLSTKISKFLEGVGTPYLQYYWEHTLYSENTKLSVTGPTYLHPASDLEKIQDLGKETLYTEEALRIAQQQKRNVSLSSTTKPYKYGISGPARVKNIFVMKEPKDKLTNPLGEETNWDIEDGGEHILLHHRLLENDSLQGVKDAIHHKPFAVEGIMMDGAPIFPMMKKYASFAMHNYETKNSLAYENMVKFALSQSIPFLNMIDFTKDYDGNTINYHNFNINIEIESGDVLKLLTLKRVGEKYVATYQNLKNGQEISNTVDIKTLYDLYMILGTSNTVSVDSNGVPKSNNINSQVALKNIINLVGFRLESLKDRPELYNLTVDQYARMSNYSREQIREAGSDYDTQLNVVQPLKYSYITAFIPESAIKFGGIEPNDVDFDKVMSDEEWATINDRTKIISTYTYVQGIQQNAEHFTEQSTEITQLVNGMSLDNESPEFLQLYDDINNYIIRSMKKAYPKLFKDKKVLDFAILNDFEKHPELALHQLKQLSFLLVRMKNQVLNSVYNIGQTTNLVLDATIFAEWFIEFDKNNPDMPISEKMNVVGKAYEDGFKVAFSHPSLYNIFITTLTSTHTKIGIRRKGAGGSDVLVPHSKHVRFVEVPKIETQLHSRDFYINHPKYIYVNDKLIFNYENSVTLSVKQFKELAKKRPEYNTLLTDYRFKDLVILREKEITTDILDTEAMNAAQALEPKKSKKSKLPNIYKKQIGLVSDLVEDNITMYRHYIYVIKGETEVKALFTKDYNDLFFLKQLVKNNMLESLKLDRLSNYDKQFTSVEGRKLQTVNFEVIYQNRITGHKKIFGIYDTLSTELLFSLYNNPNTLTEVKQRLIQVKNTLPAILQEALTDIVTNGDLLDVRRFLNRLNTHEYAMIESGKGSLSEPLSGDYDFMGGYSYDAEVISNSFQMKRLNLTNRESLLDLTYERIVADLESSLGEYRQLNLKVAGTTDSKNTPYTPIQFWKQDVGNVYLVENLPLTGLVKLEADSEFVLTDELTGKKYVSFENNETLIEITDEVKDSLYISRINDNPKLIIKIPPLSYLENLGSDYGSFFANLQENIDSINQGNFLVKTEPEGPEYVTPPNNVKNPKTFLFNLLPYTHISSMHDEVASKSLHKSIRTSAKQIYNAAQISLRLATSRIPGQSYQSFSSARITNTFPDQEGYMMVNDFNIWLTGGDFDIDKLYSLSYNLTRNSNFIGWNPLFNKTTFEHLAASLNLPYIGQTIKAKDRGGINMEDIYHINVEGKQLSASQLIKKVIRISRDKKDIMSHTNVNIDEFVQFVKLYNELIKKGYLFRTADEDLQKLLELMEVNEWTSVDDGKALQNRMVYAMRNNLSDIRNAVALFSPVSVSSPKKLKHQSEKSRILVHSSNPNKLNTDINNQDAGKSVVGIMAAGLKLYATISYVTEKNLYQDKSAEELKRMLFNHELIIVKENEVTFKVTNGFQGINYNLNPEVYAEQVKRLGVVEADKQIVEQLKNYYKEDSVQLNISALLSAATDNGKEMILGIINSGKKTQNIYVYALMLGYSLDQIGGIMTSTVVDFVLKNVETSVLMNEPSRTIRNMVSYLFDVVDLKHFAPGGAIRNIYSALGKKKAEILDMTRNGELRAYLDGLSVNTRSSLSQVSLEPSSDNDFEDEIWDYEGLFSSYVKPTFNGLEALYKLVAMQDEINVLMGDDLKNKHIRNAFQNLLDGADIITQTTMILSANQAVKVDDTELIKFYVDFEDMIRNTTNIIANQKGEVKSRTPNKLQININDFLIENRQLIEELQKFQLDRFFEDEKYANDMIKTFDFFKVDLNPLHLIKNAKHFYGMIKVVMDQDRLAKNRSIKYRTLQDFIVTNRPNGEKPLIKKTMDVVHFMRAEGASSAEPHMERQTTTFIKRSLKPAILSVLESTIDSVFVEKSLIAIQDVLHNDGKTIKIDIDGQTFNVNLGLFQGNTKVAGRKEFITFVESYLIPWLKIGKLHKDDPTNVKLMENNFIKNLKRKESFIRGRRGLTFDLFGVSNFKASDSITTKERQNDLTLALYELENIRFKGTSLIDILFLYNLIVNRGKDGENTLSTFFQPNKIPGSIVDLYQKVSSQIENNQKLLTIQLEDLQDNAFDDMLDDNISLLSHSDATIEQNHKYLPINTSSTSSHSMMKPISNAQNLEEAFSEMMTDLFGKTIKFTCI